MKITREQIAAAAFALMQEQGLDGLAMRALAARLGVQASALYWHVPNKKWLCGLMAEQFYGTAYAEADTAPSAAQWLEILGRKFRENLLSCRDSARLCANAPPSVDDTPETRERLTKTLLAFGLPQEQALNAVASVLALTLGWVVYEQSETMHDHLRSMLDFDVAYAIGLRAMIQGLLR